MTAEIDPSSEAVRTIASLHQVSLEAGLSETLNELIFRILNRTVTLCRYDRAVLWDLRGSRIDVMGISGKTQVDRQAPIILQWQQAVSALEEKETARVISEGDFKEMKEEWAALTKLTSGLSVAWLPIKIKGEVVAGLWLERWGEDIWDEKDISLLKSLVLGYEIAWRRFSEKFSLKLWAENNISKNRLIKISAVILLILIIFPVRLRVAAPCEVVPMDPAVIKAPLDGVIAEVPVKPGQEVNKNDLLLKYEKETVLKELEVARRQVGIARSSLHRARVESLDGRGERAVMVMYAQRLEQELARLKLAEANSGKLEIRSPENGVVVVDDPSSWTGRPVALGEKIMSVVDPGRTKVRIWLPENDNVEFDRETPAAIILNVDPSGGRKANLNFVARHAGMSPEGVPSFQAEALWLHKGEKMRVGLKGTAVLYGERVSLGYWLLRKPISAARRFVGF